VDQVRSRAKLGNLPASAAASKENMKAAVLNERRLELAFEGQRWFDLVRNDQAIPVLNTLNSRDPDEYPCSRLPNKLFFCQYRRRQ
jgi:hypothetical protein